MTTIPDSKETSEQFFKRTVFECCDALQCYPSILVYEVKEMRDKAIVSVPDPEPKELWGKLPEIRRGVEDKFYTVYNPGGQDEWELESPVYPTRFEAILAWNKIADALEGVEM